MVAIGVQWTEPCQTTPAPDRDSIEITALPIAACHLFVTIVEMIRKVMAAIAAVGNWCPGINDLFLTGLLKDRQQQL